MQGVPYSIMSYLSSRMFDKSKMPIIQGLTTLNTVYYCCHGPLWL